MRILIVAPAWIGDTVMAQPLFRRLHALHPGLELDALGPAWSLPLLERMPEVRAGIASPFGHGELRLAERRRLGRRLAEQGYDQAIVLPNSLKSALAPFFAGIPRRTGFLGEARWGLLNDVRRLDPAALPLMVERFLALAEPPGAPLPDWEVPRLAVDEDTRRATLARLGLDPSRPAVAFCPGAEYGPAKRWPPEHYAALARDLIAAGDQVWLVGSARDRLVSEPLAAAAGEGCVDLCGRTALPEALDLLASAQAVVSNDSGLMHVAAALDRPLVAIFGSSSPGFTPPLSERARVLSLGLPCSPCFKRECPLKHLDCLLRLTPGQVAEALAAQRAG